MAGLSPLLPSGSEVCRTWTNGHCTSSFTQCNTVTNALGVMTCITVSTAPPLPPTIAHALVRTTPLHQGLTLWPLVFCPSLLHVLLCLPSSVSSLLQFFSQVCCGSATSSRVLVPSLLYSSGELDLPFTTCSCAFIATSSFSCSHLSAHYLRLNV